MNWENISKILGAYTQYKHYQILFEKYNLPKKGSRDESYKELYKAVNEMNLFGPIISPSDIEEWLALHQIDGNNYTFVYNLRTKIENGLLKEIYDNRNKLIELKLWEIEYNNESEELENVMPNLNGVKLTGIHRNEEKGKYIFSFIAPCEVTGSRLDGSSRIYKKLFFCHCVFFDNSTDMKIIFNPTSNLLNVYGVKKAKRHDWSPIAELFFEKIKEYVGDIEIIPPNWIPQALFELAEDATCHKNPEITEKSFRAQSEIEQFAIKLLRESGIDTDNQHALVNKFVQDIQISFESQLIEVLGFNEEDDNISIFKQRSDGVTHIISVESTKDGFKSGSATQAAKKSRQEGDIDLLGVLLKTDERVYKFLVEQGRNAYLIRGTNTFVEEEVVNIVIRRLNEYREQIQSSSVSYSGRPERIAITEAK